MIKLAQIQVEIAAPVAQVFNYTTNMENYQHWFPGVINIESRDQQAHAQRGKQYLETLALPDGSVDLIIEVMECEQNRFFMTQGNLIGVLPQMTMKFTALTQSSCLLDLQYHSREPNLTLNDDIIIALRQDLGTRIQEGTSKLKQLMEQDLVIA